MPESEIDIDIQALLGGTEANLDDGLTAHWEPGAIQVTFPNGRGQKVRYRRRGEHYLFTSRVATEPHLRHVSWHTISREILLQNRTTEVVAFRIRNWQRWRPGLSTAPRLCGKEA